MKANYGKKKDNKGKAPNSMEEYLRSLKTPDNESFMAEVHRKMAEMGLDISEEDRRRYGIPEESETPDSASQVVREAHAEVGHKTRMIVVDSSSLSDERPAEDSQSTQDDDDLPTA